jgi:hypothetical protein
MLCSFILQILCFSSKKFFLWIDKIQIYAGFLAVLPTLPCLKYPLHMDAMRSEILPLDLQYVIVFRKSLSNGVVEEVQCCFIKLCKPIKLW